LLAMATIGLSKSSSVIPVARQSARAPAMFRPWVVVRERSSGMHPGYARHREATHLAASRKVTVVTGDGTTTSMVPVIEAVDVAKSWGPVQALAGATCAIGTGVTGLLGSNGAGKTTLLGMILGLHPPDR